MNNKSLKLGVVSLILIITLLLQINGASAFSIISGTVKIDGVPANNVDVRFMDLNTFEVSLPTRTDNEGHYILMSENSLGNKLRPNNNILLTVCKGSINCPETTYNINSSMTEENIKHDFNLSICRRALVGVMRYVSTQPNNPSMTTPNQKADYMAEGDRLRVEKIILENQGNCEIAPFNFSIFLKAPAAKEFVELPLLYYQPAPAIPPQHWYEIKYLNTTYETQEETYIKESHQRIYYEDSQNKSFLMNSIILEEPGRWYFSFKFDNLNDTYESTYFQSINDDDLSINSIKVREKTEVDAVELARNTTGVLKQILEDNQKNNTKSEWIMILTAIAAILVSIGVAKYNSNQSRDLNEKIIKNLEALVRDVWGEIPEYDKKKNIKNKR